MSLVLRDDRLRSKSVEDKLERVETEELTVKVLLGIELPVLIMIGLVVMRVEVDKVPEVNEVSDEFISTLVLRLLEELKIGVEVVTCDKVEGICEAELYCDDVEGLFVEASIVVLTRLTLAMELWLELTDCVD